MNDKLENLVNRLQGDMARKTAREIEKTKAFQEGYSQGIEDLYKYMRQEGLCNYDLTKE